MRGKQACLGLPQSVLQPGQQHCYNLLPLSLEASWLNPTDFTQGVMNVWGGERLRWWTSEVVNVWGGERLILHWGWWTSGVVNVWFYTGGGERLGWWTSGWWTSYNRFETFILITQLWELCVLDSKLLLKLMTSHNSDRKCTNNYAANAHNDKRLR